MGCTRRESAGLRDNIAEDQLDQRHEAAGGVIVAAVRPHQQQHVQQWARQLRQRGIVVPGSQPLQHGAQRPQEARVVCGLHARRRDLLHQPALSCHQPQC